MTTGTTKTQGTKIYFSLPDSSSTIMAVACPTAVSGLGGAANQIDITCLDSAEMEYVRGMKNPAAISIPINFIDASAAHQALQDLDDSGAVVSFMVAAPGAPAPTDIDSDGHLVSEGPTTCEFLGYVADINYDVPINSIWKATLSIQRTGPKTWDRPAVSLP